MIDKTKNPKGAGRKPIADELKAKIRSIKLTDAEWDVYQKQGGTKWLREILTTYIQSPPQ